MQLSKGSVYSRNLYWGIVIFEVFIKVNFIGINQWRSYRTDVLPGNKILLIAINMHEIIRIFDMCSEQLVTVSNLRV